MAQQADVLGSEHHVPGELPLDGQTQPLGSPLLGFVDVHEADRGAVDQGRVQERKVLGKNVDSLIPIEGRRQAEIGSRCGHRGAETLVGHAGAVAHFPVQGEVHQPVIGSRHGLLVQLVGKAQPRPETPESDVERPDPAVASLSLSVEGETAREAARRRIGSVDVHEAPTPVGLVERYGDLPPKAVVDRQPRSRPPRILGVESPAVAGDLPGAGGLLEDFVHVAHEEGGEPVPRLRKTGQAAGAVAEGISARRVVFHEESSGPDAELGADLHVVVPAGPGQVHEDGNRRLEV